MNKLDDEKNEMNEEDINFNSSLKISCFHFSLSDNIKAKFTSFMTYFDRCFLMSRWMLGRSFRGGIVVSRILSGHVFFFFFFGLFVCLSIFEGGIFVFYFDL